MMDYPLWHGSYLCRAITRENIGIRKRVELALAQVPGGGA